MSKFLPPLLLAGLIAAGGVAQAADGKALHDQHCMSCHKSMMDGDPNSIYTRDNRMISSLDGLRKQVRRCELSLGLQWFDDQVNAVTTYLNQNFYKF